MSARWWPVGSGEQQGCVARVGQLLGWVTRAVWRRRGRPVGRSEVTAGCSWSASLARLVHGQGRDNRQDPYLWMNAHRGTRHDPTTPRWQVTSASGTLGGSSTGLDRSSRSSTGRSLDAQQVTVGWLRAEERRSVVVFRRRCSTPNGCKARHPRRGPSPTAGLAIRRGARHPPWCSARPNGSTGWRQMVAGGGRCRF